jgi:hypothetical protein
MYTEDVIRQRAEQSHKRAEQVVARLEKAEQARKATGALEALRCEWRDGNPSNEGWNALKWLAKNWEIAQNVQLTRESWSGIQDFDVEVHLHEDILLNVDSHTGAVRVYLRGKSRFCKCRVRPAKAV